MRSWKITYRVQDRDSSLNGTECSTVINAMNIFFAMDKFAKTNKSENHFVTKVEIL